MTSTVAIVNQKGGVGKTATTLGIASALNTKAKKVLVIDLDPQANATRGLGVQVLEDTLTSGDVIAGNNKGVAAQAIVATKWGSGVDCIPSGRDVQERDHDNKLGFEFRLRRALEGVNDYDMILIDCPPSIGHLTANALLAADLALLVTEAAADSIAAIYEILTSIEVVKENYQTPLDVAGIVVNKLDLRTSEQRYRLEELTTIYGHAVWEPYVPQRSTIAEAKGAQAPIHDFGYRAKDVTEVYDTLADQLLKLGEEAA